MRCLPHGRRGHEAEAALRDVERERIGHVKRHAQEHVCSRGHGPVGGVCDPESEGMEGHGKLHGWGVIAITVIWPLAGP